ncbi:MAG: carbohydrate ABC transporter permease [Verrucomicrobia bacterium]|nr:carbohydrate ABC transporter permease [Verrucomicrobiota bacterium]
MIWLVLSPLLLVILFPFGVMFLTAVKPRSEVFSYPPRWLPTSFRWENFVEMWNAANFGSALWNSLVISIGATILVLIVSVPAAYAIARFTFALKQPFSQFLLATQMLSPILLVLGLFHLVVFCRLIDSKYALILIYAAFNIAFAVWMLRSYFGSIPVELEEAALIDGCSRLAAIIRIFVPLALPAMVVTAIFTFINSWNEFVVALTLLRSQENFTLPLRVFSLVGGRYTVEWEQVMAATLLATLPVAILFTWLQRYLMSGLTMGAIK